MKLLHWLIRHQKGYIFFASLLVLLTASVVGWHSHQKQQADQRLPLTQSIEQLVATIEAGTINSQAMGAAILFGLNNEAARQLLLQQTLAGTDVLEQSMSALRQQFLAEEVLLVDAQHIVVAYAGGQRQQTGQQLADWDGVLLALQGNPNVYPQVKQQQRIIYLIAPVRRDHDSRSSPLGAILVGINADKLDRVFEHWSAGDALLLSPAGLVFSAAHPEWLLKPPNFPMDVTHLQRQQPHLLDKRSVDWPSANGEWQLVVLSHPVVWWQSATVIASMLLVSVPLAFILWMFFLLLRYEHGLLKGAALLRESHEIASLCTYELDMSQRRFTVSDEAYKLFGIPADFPLTLENWLMQVHPDDREMLEQYLAQLQLHRKNFDREYRIYRHHDQALCWIHVLGRVEYNEQGQVLRVHGTAQDITKQKNIELRLRVEHEQSQRYLDTTLALMVELDKNGNVVMLNRAARTLLGYRERELKGRNWFDTCLPQPFGTQIAYPYFQSIISGEQQSAGEFEHVVLCRDGSTRLIAWRNTLRYDAQGKVVGTLSSGIDVTESRELAQQLETIIDKSPSGIAAFRENGDCVMVNAAYARLLDKQQADIRQQNLFHDSVWQQHGLLDLANQCLLKRQTVRQDIELSLKKNTVALECILSPIMLSAKPHLLLLLNDITVRQQAERALSQSLQQVEQKELSKTRFLAAAGHDLRQPLAAANLFVNTLKYTQPTSAQLELIQRLEQSMSAFSGLLECLLDISKLDAGLIQPKFEVVPLTDIFAWLDHHFSALAIARKLRLMFHFPPQPVYLYTDRELLKTILMNLVSNALKFTSRGGILIGARLRGPHLLLQVWDTGIGISEKHLPFIFDEFYQVANPQRNREAGLGLGLASCQRRMALLGGKVSCHSRPGRGSVFSLQLPIHADLFGSSPVLGDTNVFDPSFAAGRKMVVIEDDQLLSDATSLLLQHMGAEVKLFTNAEQALLWPALLDSDYFIVDYALDGPMSGLDFLRKLQQASKKPIHAVLVTGETSSAFISSTQNCPWPVLYKPVDIGKLSHALLHGRCDNL